MDIEVHPSVLAVHIHVDIGIEKRVVQGCVEDGRLLFRSPFNLDFAQCLIPFAIGRPGYPGEIPTGGLSLQILSRAIDAHG